MKNYWDYDNEPKDLVMTEGHIVVERMREPDVDKFLRELANECHKVARDVSYGGSYRIDEDFQIIAHDTSNEDNYVPIISGDIDFWCESYEYGLRNTLEYLAREYNANVKLDVSEWGEPL